MNSIRESAARFFDACETGKGWSACRQFCHADASFSARADMFEGTDTIEDYTESMRHLNAGPIPDGNYEMKSFAVDEERGNVNGWSPPWPRAARRRRMHPITTRCCFAMSRSSM